METTLDSHFQQQGSFCHNGSISEYMLLCHIRFYRKNARQKVVRVNVALRLCFGYDTNHI